jgi:hypothetical protein
MTKKKESGGPAGRLLEAQVAWFAEQLSGEGLDAIIEEEVDATLQAAGKLKLSDLATREGVKKTLRRLLVEVAPGDSWAELVVDLATHLHESPANAKVRTSDLLPEDLVERIVDRGLAMNALREALIRGVIASPAYTAFASDLLYQGIRGYLAENAVTRSIPGAQSMMKLGRAALSRASPGLESALEDGIKKYIAQAVKHTSEHSVELLLSADATRDLRRTALSLWQGLSRFHISDFRRQLSREDFGLLARLAYEVVTVLRRSNYVAALADACVDGFFDRYESQPLSRLFAEAGVSRALLVEEIGRHLAPALKQLRRKKLLEPVLRRRLKGFYESEAALGILQESR